MATLTEQLSQIIRTRYEVEVAHGKGPSRAIDALCFRFGMKRAEVKAIVQTKPPAARRLTQQNQEAPKR